MKIERKNGFQPIVITLETLEEAASLMKVVQNVGGGPRGPVESIRKIYEALRAYEDICEEIVSNKYNLEYDHKYASINSIYFKVN